MKKILLALSFVSCMLTANVLLAQTFTASDTVWASISGVGTANDNITNLSSGNITLRWHVVASNFPIAPNSDWLADTALGICDNNLCRGNNSAALWNGTSGSPYTSNAYAPGGGGAFSLSLNLTGSTVGTHYITINLQDVLSSTNKNITFIITKPFPAAVSNVNISENDVVLYPNPARDELNVVYSATADVKNITVYNIIGKIMAVYKVTGSSANLNLENMSSGIYFVRLSNAHGDVVATKKFTKQ